MNAPTARTRLLLIAHAPLAQALRACALHVFPDCAADVQALDVPADESPEHTLAAARALIGPPGTTVLLLTDVYGATPANVARRLLQEPPVGISMQLITGVNLPMLLRAISYRHEMLPAVVERALVGATQGIMRVATPSTMP